MALFFFLRPLFFFFATLVAKKNTKFGDFSITCRSILTLPTAFCIIFPMIKIPLPPTFTPTSHMANFKILDFLFFCELCYSKVRKKNSKKFAKKNSFHLGSLGARNAEIATEYESAFKIMPVGKNSGPQGPWLSFAGPLKKIHFLPLKIQFSKTFANLCHGLNIGPRRKNPAITGVKTTSSIDCHAHFGSPSPKWRAAPPVFFL